jgi:hypothetical protein
MATGAGTNGRTGQVSTATQEQPATTETRGRKKLCGFDMGNGASCELTQGHEGKHLTIDISDADLEMSFIPADEVPTITRSVQERKPEQIKIDGNVDAVYKEWLKQGAQTDAPLWARVTVAPHKVQKMQRMLRRAADDHKPPVQLRLGTPKNVAGGKVQVPFAAVNRRVYNRKP